MAAYRIRWKHVLRNVFQVAASLQTLGSMWPSVKAKLVELGTTDKTLAAFIGVIDNLLDTLVRRK